MHRDADQAASLLSREKIEVCIYEDSSDASLEVARQIINCVRATGEKGEKCVLGLATGSSPSQIYRRLVKEHKESGLSFRHVVTFNLDEYYPMDPGSLQSYHRFMHESLFDHVNILPENIHIPDGLIPRPDIESYCQDYETKLRELGPIDIQLLGLGRTGHIGFNEQGSNFESQTRVVYLDKVTRTDAAADFFHQAHVPRQAITMGLDTIMQAKRILLVAFGENKANAIQRAVEGNKSEDCAASILQSHPDVTIFADAAASAGLTRVKCPWTVGEIEWTEQAIRKALTWLSKQTGKALLQLTAEDYEAHGMQALLLDNDPVELNERVFQHLQSTITGNPAEGPISAESASSNRRHATSSPHKILIMSPHPDDDVISCGGTFIRLVEQGNEVHVAYQTSGNVAVSDEQLSQAVLFRDLMQSTTVPDSSHAFPSSLGSLADSLEAKTPGQVDSEEVLKLKKLLRYSEAISGARVCGVKDVSRLHFLDLPFYQTGMVTKKPLSHKDVDIVVRLFRELQPKQIYAAGDLSDPHGTHRTCLQAIVLALEEVKSDEWYQGTEVWLYRGAWQEFEPYEIEMAVPMNPEQLAHKIEAIFRHQSQKDRAMFPGADSREFWQRARDRNKALADLYSQLGLQRYEAMEAFVRYDPNASNPFFSHNTEL